MIHLMVRSSEDQNFNRIFLSISTVISNHLIHKINYTFNHSGNIFYSFQRIIFFLQCTYILVFDSKAAI